MKHPPIDSASPLVDQPMPPFQAEGMPDIVPDCPEVRDIIAKAKAEGAHGFIAEDSPLYLGTVQTTPVAYDVKVKGEAYQMFLETDLTSQEIGLTLGIPMSTVQKWMADEKWAVRKKVIDNEIALQLELEYHKHVRKYRIPTAVSHLRRSELLESMIERASEEVRALADSGVGVAEYSKILKRLAETLSLSAGVSAKAAGMDTITPAMLPDGINRPDHGAGRVPLVVVNNIGPQQANGPMQVHEIHQP